jgi:F0F1-type ATP synthase delta subunit
MKTNPFTKSLINQLHLTLQVDLLHLALTNLMEMVVAGEIDLILDQQMKSITQKKAFIAKIVSMVESPLLRKALEEKLAKGDLEFFRERNLGDILRHLQHAAEEIAVVKLRFALDFKEVDLHEMVAQLEEQLDKKVVLDISVDRSLIGGAIVQYGTFIRDYTVRARLEQFRDHWQKAALEA